jgi:hypothetical protein
MFIFSELLFISFLCFPLLKSEISISMGHPQRIGAYKILRGHTSSVQSVAVDPSKDMVMINISVLLNQCCCCAYLSIHGFLLTSLGN